MTTIYFMRHSIPLDFEYLNNVNNNDVEQVKNEKWPLTIEGEALARSRSEREIFKNLDMVYASNYVRAISTAKYFSETINIDQDFGERKFGVDKWEDLPKDFGLRQIQDFDYKVGNGESLNEVKTRMLNGLNNILDNHKDQTVLVISHGTALTCLLSNWCEINYDMEKEILEYYYNNKFLLKGRIGYCNIVKLEFNDKELINLTYMS
jgi:2,3-bisphosphoglycerate-dependent phosphoglycerate mutase